MTKPLLLEGIRLHNKNKIYTEYDYEELEEVWQCSECESNYETFKEADDCCCEECQEKGE